jgi:hypothetical protein
MKPRRSKGPEQTGGGEAEGMCTHTAAGREFFETENHFVSDAQMISSSFRMKTRLRWWDGEVLLEGWPNLI